MAEFTYNNTKNASSSHTLFELNCNYYFCMFYKEDINSWFKSKLANELFLELWELMTSCYKNLQYVQDLEKQAHDKNIKSRSYALGNQIWLNAMYIKIKQNWKLETKFLELF